MNVFYVGGSQRSGTTLLQNLLCQAESANPMIREASYFRALVQVYKYGKDDFENDTKDYFCDRMALQEFHASILEKFLVVLCRKYSNSSNLVLKEPHLTMLFPELYELLPDSRFIVLVRDPRDIIASMVKVGEAIKAQGNEHFFQDRDMVQLSNHVKRFYWPCLSNKDEGFGRQILYVKYEDLVTEPAVVIDTLNEYTGLDLKPDTGKISTSDHFGADVLSQRYSPWYKSDSGGGITNSSIGNYKNVLSALEIKQVESSFTGFMKRFDY